MRLFISICTIAALAITSCNSACSSPIANAESADSVRGYWETEDRELIIEVAGCEEGTEILCGFIRALPGTATDPEIARYADELCGLALLSNLTFDSEKNRWSDGDIFDPETEQMYAVYIERKPDYLKVRAFEGSEWLGETLKWRAFEAPVEDCAIGSLRK